MTRVSVALLAVVGLTVAACTRSRNLTPPPVVAAANAAERQKAYRQCTPDLPADQTCGSISPTLHSSEYKASFIEAVCPGLSAEDCSARFNRMWLARLVERYASADVEGVGRKCDAYPVECRDPVIVEDWFRASHNRALSQSLEEIRREEAQRNAEQGAAKRRAIGGALKAFGDSFSGSTNCTSTPIGNTVQTTCR